MPRSSIGLSKAAPDGRMDIRSVYRQETLRSYCREQFAARYDVLSPLAAALSATGFTGIRQQRGNSASVPSCRATLGACVSHLESVAGNVAENRVHVLVTEGIGLLEPYRYGDSNPGFRTENCLWQAICGRSGIPMSSWFSRVRSSSVESGTYFGTRFRPPGRSIRRAR